VTTRLKIKIDISQSADFAHNHIEISCYINANNHKLLLYTKIDKIKIYYGLKNRPSSPSSLSLSLVSS
jgi:hypothetical protein